MALADVTAADVLAAIAEYDRLGREEFLQQYGFGDARTYFLEYDAKLYDSKAILGYAHGVSQGKHLRGADFSGGDRTVVYHLRRLGFVTKTRQNPDWTRDEVVLACQLTMENGWKSVGASDPRVGELSDLLQLQRAHPAELRGAKFRNRNGVGRKTVDIATQHPDYKGKATNGGQHDRKVLLEFLADPARMTAEAAAIRAAILADAAEPAEVADLDLDGLSADEGRVLERLHLRRERDARLRDKVVQAYKRRHSAVACEACGFDFGTVYGERGSDYIEVHHRTPLHVSGPTKTRPEDLVLLCSNCHRMIHCKAPWLTVDELVSLLEKHRAS